ncbi:hypothetical protein [Gluconobacter sp. Dm-73]|nr:hypothetical protein [Gluconobacter sp. Dm-73]
MRGNRVVDLLKFGERSDRLDRANPEPSVPVRWNEGVETVRATP